VRGGEGVKLNALINAYNSYLNPNSQVPPVSGGDPTTIPGGGPSPIGVGQAPPVSGGDPTTIPGGGPNPVGVGQVRGPNQSAYQHANPNASFLRQNPPGQRPAMSNPLVSSMAGPVGGDQRVAASQWLQSLMQRNPQILEALTGRRGLRPGSGSGGGTAYPRIQPQGGPAIAPQAGPVGSLAPQPAPMPYNPNVPNLYNLAVPFGRR